MRTGRWAGRASSGSDSASRSERNLDRRAGDQEKKTRLSPDLLASFYEVVGCQAPAFVDCSSELPPERPPPEQGGRGGGARRHAGRPIVQTIRSHTGRSVKVQALPDHLLSVVARGHSPAAACAGPRGAPLHLLNGSR